MEVFNEFSKIPDRILRMLAEKKRKALFEAHFKKNKEFMEAVEQHDLTKVVKIIVEKALTLDHTDGKYSCSLVVSFHFSYCLVQALAGAKEFSSWTPEEVSERYGFPLQSLLNASSAPFFKLMARTSRSLLMSLCLKV